MQPVPVLNPSAPPGTIAARPGAQGQTFQFDLAGRPPVGMFKGELTREAATGLLVFRTPALKLVVPATLAAHLAIPVEAVLRIDPAQRGDHRRAHLQLLTPDGDADTPNAGRTPATEAQAAQARSGTTAGSPTSATIVDVARQGARAAATEAVPALNRAPGPPAPSGQAQAHVQPTGPMPSAPTAQAAAPATPPPTATTGAVPPGPTVGQGGATTAAASTAPPLPTTAPPTPLKPSPSASAAPPTSGSSPSGPGPTPTASAPPPEARPVQAQPPVSTVADSASSRPATPPAGTPAAPVSTPGAAAPPQAPASPNQGASAPAATTAPPATATSTAPAASAAGTSSLTAASTSPPGGRQPTPPPVAERPVAAPAPPTKLDRVDWPSGQGQTGAPQGGAEAQAASASTTRDAVAPPTRFAPPPLATTPPPLAPTAAGSRLLALAGLATEADKVQGARVQVLNDGLPQALPGAVLPIVEKGGRVVLAVGEEPGTAQGASLPRRLVVELELPELGHVRLDGLANGGRFDVLMSPVADHLRPGLRALWALVRGYTGLEGDLSFHDRPEPDA